ncbi:hypothetical protein Pfo_015708 [Paulownia fortunei]|nr:hypothetical protein Pfo_015708 [Paulownia fortunei]
MDSSRNPCILQVLILCSVLILHSVNTLIIDNQKLVYSQCSNQTSPNPSHSSLLSALFQEFMARSSQSRFFETIVADDTIAISGTFQCRNDLSPDDCRSCVSKFPDMSTDTNSRPDQLLHRACSKHKVNKNDFEEMKYAAFAALESGVMNGNGFCEMTYESIHVVAQCAGSLGACDCVECVNNAVQIAAEDECRYSVSGEIYLDSCFISYDYYRNHGFGGYSDEDNGKGDKSPKLVAIVIGGLAVLSVGLAFCYFMRSFGKEKDEY